ncbi:hypothetical protein QWQ33_004186 [Salmonella enterica]|uniref:Uncharacterized protein n=1 Tax=Salmonella enterica I TaxID=59201 RepID=A0A7Z1T8K5_SALET|nr:hypothetical protein [Salmonella enterica]EAO9965153.1 hypothetical protein [Salmonella enterica]EAV3184161.1 hypothetical protein [Salmonella enterica subsp. enterica]EAV3941186.1 hypothetical protein [Salmonella enterica]EAW0862861.1 hypothetical protein [Salmonella enterica]EAW2470264.1 hypothetical protein [Salmonella enterica subsp. enterica]
MVNADSLKRCFEFIKKIDDSSPLWIPSYSEAKNLSFISGKYDFRRWIDERNKIDSIYSNIKTHEDFEELLHHLEQKNETICSHQEISFCNDILSEILNDRHIARALLDGGVVILPVIEPNRYIKFRALNRIISGVQRADIFAYWQQINDFTDKERELFNGKPYKFHKKLVYIMYGYVSGEIRQAYAEGIETLDKYKQLLKEICELEKNSLFSYLTERHGRVFHGEDDILMTVLAEIDKAKAGVISTRNDNSLAERAFVTELLKLFYTYGGSNPTSAVYRFTRTNFMLNDIERKTIQRCWDSLSSYMDKNR